MTIKTCKACGCGFDADVRMRDLDRDALAPGQNELAYCRDCADEIYRDTISTTPARTFPSGSGECVYRDDPSPWEENNIRIMEDV